MKISTVLIVALVLLFLFRDRISEAVTPTTKGLTPPANPDYYFARPAPAENPNYGVSPPPTKSTNVYDVIGSLGSKVLDLGSSYLNKRN